MKKALSYLVLFLLASTMAVAQNFPVQCNVNITPPYSVYLSDYASMSSDKLLVTLMLKDVNQSDIQVKLRLTIKGNGIEIRTKADYQPQPLLLQGGAPLLISGTELEGYLNPDNLDVSGISKSQFAKNKKLPEGVYQFMAEAVEYRRNVTISNQGMTVGWLVLNDPPRWTLPMTNSLLTATYPQNIFFSWMPMSTASPNAAFTTEYEFTIVELWPEGRAPGDAINSSIPIYQTTTSNTSLVYGPAEPELVPGRKYVCRLRAYDTEGRDLFKNNGYSEILVFTYGQACKPPNTFEHQVLGPEDARVNWTSLPGNTQFILSYAEQNADATWSNWYNNETMVPFSAIKGLKPAHTYRYQLKAICGTLESEYSETKQFSTSALDTNQAECGKDISIPKLDDSQPLPTLKVGDIINVGGFEARIIEVEGSGGSFSGKCAVNVKTFGGVRILSEFENISVNESHQVTAGVINSVKGELNIIGLDGILDSLGITGNNDVVDNDGGNGDPNVGDPYEDGDSILVVLGGEEFTITGDTTIITAAGDTIVTDFSQIPPIIVVNGDATDITTDKLDYDHVDDGSGNDVATNVTDTAAYAIKMVKFRPAKKQLFGFDLYPEDIPQFWADYHKERVNKKDYPINWKSNQSLGLPDNVVMDIVTDNPDSIKTRLSVESSVVGRLDYSFNAEDSTWVILLNGQSHENEDRITAYYTQDDGSKIAVGFLDMVSYNEQKVKLVIVPVGDKYGFEKNPNYTELKDSLNAIYKGAITFWDVSITDPLVVDYEDNDKKGLDTDLPDMAAYTKEMRNLRSALKDRSDYNKDAYYLFLIDKSENGDKNGIMPFRRHFGFIFMDDNGKLKDNKEKMFHTIAHELGHGAFGLEHVWQDNGPGKGSTYNLMDYTSKKPDNLLRKYQWHYIHNPKMSLFGGDEEETSDVILEVDLISDRLSYVWYPTDDVTNTTIDAKFDGIYTPGGIAIKLNNPDKIDKISFDALTGGVNSFVYDKDTYSANYSKNSTSGEISFYGYTRSDYNEVLRTEFLTEITQNPDYFLTTSIYTIARRIKGKDGIYFDNFSKPSDNDIILGMSVGDGCEKKVVTMKAAGNTTIPDKDTYQDEVYNFPLKESPTVLSYKEEYTIVDDIIYQENVSKEKLQEYCKIIKTYEKENYWGRYYIEGFLHKNNIEITHLLDKDLEVLQSLNVITGIYNEFGLTVLQEEEAKLFNKGYFTPLNNAFMDMLGFDGYDTHGEISNIREFAKAMKDNTDELRSKIEKLDHKDTGEDILISIISNFTDAQMQLLKPGTRIKLLNALTKEWMWTADESVAIRLIKTTNNEDDIVKLFDGLKSTSEKDASKTLFEVLLKRIDFGKYDKFWIQVIRKYRFYVAKKELNKPIYLNKIRNSLATTYVPATDFEFNEPLCSDIGNTVIREFKISTTQTTQGDEVITNRVINLIYEIKTSCSFSPTAPSGDGSGLEDKYAEISYTETIENPGLDFFYPVIITEHDDYPLVGEIIDQSGSPMCVVPAAFLLYIENEKRVATIQQTIQLVGLAADVITFYKGIPAFSAAIKSAQYLRAARWGFEVVVAGANVATNLSGDEPTELLNAFNLIVGGWGLLKGGHSLITKIDDLNASGITNIRPVSIIKAETYINLYNDFAETCKKTGKAIPRKFENLNNYLRKFLRKLDAAKELAIEDIIDLNNAESFKWGELLDEEFPVTEVVDNVIKGVKKTEVNSIRWVLGYNKVIKPQYAFLNPKTGILSLDFHIPNNAIEDGIKGFGKKMFNEAFDELGGSDKIEGIEGFWKRDINYPDGESTNLKLFNEGWSEAKKLNLKGDEAYQYAANKTVTGGYARSKEYNKFIIDFSVSFHNASTDKWEQVGGTFVK